MARRWRGGGPEMACRSPGDGRVMRAQSKWGRHCCRPHSHQRVVFSSGEPSKKRLAPDVASPNGLGAYCHRRSRRHPASPFRQSCLSGPKPFKVVPTFRRHRDHFPFSGCFTQAAGFRLGVLPPSIHSQGPGLSGGSAIATFSGNCTCIRLAPCANPISNIAWTITTASVVLRNSREISSLKPDFRLGFSPFRCFETALSD